MFKKLVDTNTTFVYLRCSRKENSFVWNNEPFTIKVGNSANHGSFVMAIALPSLWVLPLSKIDLIESDNLIKLQTKSRVNRISHHVKVYQNKPSKARPPSPEAIWSPSSYFS